MQLNCLLFPRPKGVNVDAIADKIVLIPHQEDRCHVYYLNFVNPATRVKDQLAQALKVQESQQAVSLTGQMEKLGQQSRFAPHMRNKTVGLNPLKNAQKASSVVAESYSVELNTLPVLNKQDLGQPESSSARSPKQPSTKVKGYIPCLFLPGRRGKLLLYFHGNAEDIQSCSSFLKYIHKYSGYSIMAIEYEGYSIYEGSPSADKITQDTRVVIKYLTGVGLDLGKVFVIGRSIGSGPALSLVSQFNTAGIMLVSPLLSVCKLVRDKYGTVASYMIKQRFQNSKLIGCVKAPTLILHGLADTIIPHQHSIGLHELAPQSTIRLIEGMTHMCFDFHFDFLVPMQQFLSQIQF